MAQNAASSQDVQDIQFKIHDKFTIFREGKDVKSLVSLLAVSSAKGLLFAGNPNSKEIKVFKLREVIDSKTSGQEVKVRVVNLPGEPKVLACSCDGTMLSVSYVLNGTGFLQIFQVDSFVTPILNALYNIPVAPESNVFALQILWNPVIPNNIALVLTDGSMAMFTLNNGQYDKVTLPKEYQVKSGCWSPKGKQIVLGFPDGKLQQFKPNLQPARTISCPHGIHPGPFDCIAVHWLSTYQFAVIFLQRGQDTCPSLFIVNAPKAGQPSYINYYDVCYSATGPRMQQLSFYHISQWNLLLVTSANGVEVGVLGTRDSGETPNWIQYTLLDEARIEMPLTESKDETYPLGFALDTASLHQVVIGEIKLPVMPMVHVLSTHGHLVSFNFLNLAPNAADICSPPPPLNDNSGQFFALKDTMTSEGPVVISSQSKSSVTTRTSTISGLSDTTFTASHIVTSTPAIKDKPMPIFGSQIASAKPLTGFDFPHTTAVSPTTVAPVTNNPSTGYGTAATPTLPAATTVAQFTQQLGGMPSETAFGGFTGTGFSAKSSEVTNQSSALQPAQKSANTNKNSEINIPLYTVASTFTPPTLQLQSNKTETKPVKPNIATNKINLNTVEIDEVVKQMIIIQMEAFEMELKHIRQQSKHLMEKIGSPDKLKSNTKQLNNLQEIIEQANDHEFEQDVQSLRHSMNESYAMLAECRTKLELYNNPNLTRLSTISSTNPTSRRQLSKLQTYVVSNQNQLSQLNQLIDAQWSQYQDVIRRNSKNQMHIPCLDGIYQRMSKLKDLLSRQRTKMNYIKAKLKQKGLHYKHPDVDVTLMAVGALTKNQNTMESLADSILSMSLSQIVSQTHAKLSEEKLNAIRNFTKRQQQVAIVKPKRPDRIGLKSEVILETKLETERKQKEMAKKQLQQQHHQQLQQKLQKQQKQQEQQLSAYKTPTTMQKVMPPQTQLQQKLTKPQTSLSTYQQPPILAKPTASKPFIVSSQPPSFITPTSSTAATLMFGGNSSFVKTSISTSGAKPEEAAKPLAPSTPFAGFGLTASKSALSFNQPKPIYNTTITALGKNEGKENQHTPISFSAKVIGGNDAAKPFTNLSNPTTTQTVLQPQQQGFASSNSSGFMVLSTTKPTAQTSGQDKDISQKAEQASKQFSFSTAVTSAAGSAFGGFVVTSKPTTTSASSSESLFDSNSNTKAFVPFSSTSPFSFNATGSTSSTAPTTTTANDNTQVSNTFIPSSQSTAAVTAKPTEITTPTLSSASTATTEVTSTSANLDADNAATIMSTKITVPPNITITPLGLPEPKPAVATSNSGSTATTTSTISDSTDSLFGSLNICKPITKEAGDSSKPANIFSGFSAATSAASTVPFSFASASGAGDGVKPFLSSTSATGTGSNTGFSFFSADSTAPSTGKSATSETTTESVSAKDTSSTNAVTDTTVAPTRATSTPPHSSDTTAPASAGSLFSSLSMSTSTTAATTPITTTTATSTATDNIFSDGTSVIKQETLTATTSTSSSIFEGSAVVTSSVPSLFGSTVPTTVEAATPGGASVFGGSAAATTSSAGSIFGGIPKPEQSIFAAANTAAQPATTGLFAAAAAATKPQATTGGNVFGGFGVSTGGSIFGGGSAAASNTFSSTGPVANTAGSIFGAAVAASKPVEGGSIFSSPTQQSASSGGSLFGNSTFGTTAATQSTSSIFGGSTSQSPTSGGFGSSGGSIFGGSTPANNSASGGSIFGAAVAPAAPAFGSTTSMPGFGSFSQTSNTSVFNPSSAGSFSTPASGFVSPQQQSAFAKPVFGAAATFGSPQSAFGAAAPTFGGAPTFGSPKGFSSFSSTSPTSTSFGAAAQGSAASTGNIFETLGSQDSGLSFGNLANATQTQQQKPSFGGSSFMNYRS